ncbi:ROK family protein [uncultured Croceicoccus sp.]|uniref:ROK family protein n=1 Tax=uncultured Croceicoccus sp. TaxID=1295329 RepID=UPI00260F2F1D|nr:ROK family protein [uncultured Croceicoccus sp.]
MGRTLIGGIEAGGTKIVLAVAESPTEIVATHTIPTREPDETLATARNWFEENGPPCAIGIASFGPVELDPGAPQWGHILETPKAGWSQYDLAGHFSSAFCVPVGFDTDVNAAALGEYRHGAGQGAASLTYVTVGTGIGGGTVIDGRLVHGAGHPELGHIYPRRGIQDRDFPGICRFHGDCLEGLASGPAIFARWGATLSDLPDDHEAHGLVAGYLAQMCHTVHASIAAQVIVLGGGVMNTPGLTKRIAGKAQALGAGYFPGAADHRIVAPSLGDRAGITGALLLAENARGA